MWILRYRECNITIWHRRTYFFKTSIVNKIIFLKEQNYDDIFVEGPSLEDCMIWKVEYQQCNITSVCSSYFAKESEAKRFVRTLKKEYYDYVEMSTVPLGSAFKICVNPLHVGELISTLTLISC